MAANEKTTGVPAGKTSNPATKPANGDSTDVWITIVVAAILYIGLVCFARSYQEGALASTFFLVGIASGAAGWLTGIAISPYNLKEQALFTRISNAVYAFAGGYLLSKIEPLIAAAIEAGKTRPFDPDLGRMLIFGFAAYAIALALTYVTRSYWFSKNG